MFIKCILKCIHLYTTHTLIVEDAWCIIKREREGIENERGERYTLHMYMCTVIEREIDIG